MEGVWIGEGARRLGLKGGVEDKAFDAVRRNRHPDTGEQLTARESKDRVAFFDVQLGSYQGAPLTEVLRYKVKFKFVPNPDMTRNGRFPTAVAAFQVERVEKS